MKRFIATIISALTLATAMGSIAAPKAYAQDCDNNAIIYCGAVTPADLANKANANGTGDLGAIYQNFGLAPADYQNFASKARMGTAYKDGTIVVDGRVVANNAWSIGRQKFAYSWNTPIAGRTYYGSFSKDVFKSNSIPVMVMFDDSGTMKSAVLTACGNPITGDKVHPAYGCNLLNMATVTGQADTYDFTTQGNATLGAQLNSVTYDFGDGSAPATMTNLSSPVRHTYTKAGTYTARATVNVVLPGNQNGTVTSATCSKQVTVAAKTTPTPAAPAKPTTPTAPQGKSDFDSSVTPATPPATTPVVTTAVKQLPNTGAGMIFGIFLLVGGAAAGAYSYIVRRRLQA